MSKILYSFSNLRELIRREKPSKVIIVTSEKLKKLLAWAIKEIPGNPQVITIPDGEDAKNWKSLELLLKKFTEKKLDRKSLVIILGGGTAGDVGGFAASVYLRGIKYVQVPTTLVAQTDSAHGGKTGINFINAKNQIGATYFPVATIVDPRFITSNKTEQIMDGLGEIIKAGLIKDPEILKLLQSKNVAELNKHEDFEKIIKRSIKVKEYYVAKDVYDKGIRSMLNFGHTIGHALELKYKLGHGRAILVGMIKELEISEKLGITKPAVRLRLLDLYKKLGIDYHDKYKLEWKTISRDKKFSGEYILWPVVISEGKSKLIKLESKKLKRLLKL